MRPPYTITLDRCKQKTGKNTHIYTHTAFFWVSFDKFQLKDEIWIKHTKREEIKYHKHTNIFPTIMYKNTGEQRRNENWDYIVSCSVVVLQTMESYFCYSMEKCLHYSDNNTKLDSSEIFPPHQKKKSIESASTTRISSNASNDVFFFLSVFFSFLIRSFCYIQVLWISFSRFGCAIVHLFILIGCSVTRSAWINIHKTKSPENTIEIKRKKSYEINRQERRKKNASSQRKRTDNQIVKIFPMK